MLNSKNYYYFLSYEIIKYLLLKPHLKDGRHIGSDTIKKYGPLL
jgi:hypothetical protein